jgi:acyl-CoA synthetase (AMP-forming)/AMP-acid ligase II
MIIRGGFNVYPREVEEVLYEHPAVAEVAVIGIPHAQLGEVGAAVTLKPGSTATPAELRAFAREQMSRTSTRGMSGSCRACRRAPPGRYRATRCSHQRSSDDR